jgi:spore coat protein H
MRNDSEDSAMRVHHWLALAFVLPFVPLTVQPLLAQEQKKDETIDLFKPVGAIPKVKITMDQENRKLLEKDPRKYVRVNIRIGDQSFTDVGLHLKGAAGSWRGWDDKPGLTLNMDKFTKNQVFRGLEKFNLNNGVQDGSFLQELLANELALAMGVPACRCTHAIVELNGRKVGLYVLKEGFDKSWLRRHFKNADGNLYDGGFLTDINGPLKLDSGTDNGRKDLKELAKACQSGDANTKYAAVDKLLDIDSFCANAALQIVTADWDGYIRKPNNYRIYFPANGKAVVIPHGMDQMWQNPQEGLWHGWGGMIANVVLNHPEGKKKTIAKLKELSEKHFTIEKMNKRIDELYPRGKEALVTVNKDLAGWFEGETRGLKERIKQRVEYIKRELPKLK